MESRATTRRTCFIEEDDGISSLAVDMKEGFSGTHHHQYFVSKPQYYSQIVASERNMNICSVSSPRSGRFYDARYEDQQPHFLDACFLCKKPLGYNRDIYMYRGDTPFCSEECRQEQMEIDESKERRWNLSASTTALRKKEQRKSSSPTRTQDCAVHTSTVAAA